MAAKIRRELGKGCTFLDGVHNLTQFCLKELINND
ncbi:hypothetical protein RB2150_07143 [Rhodobacterales bacterium HTCC2150]|nr:hypothetical protein RB2150_07143 [Rhodobacterales bacterium HTCC2150] [Rhodobacteraceae bacterium HTCC2150]